MQNREVIELPVRSITPNLTDYSLKYHRFKWQQVRRELMGPPDMSHLNIAHLAVDRHAGRAKGEHTAFRFVAADGGGTEYSFNQLKRETDRFANVLADLGIKKGDVICTLAGRVPELYIAALGTLKHGAVYCPLFSIYGPDPVFQRLSKGKARMLVTTAELFDAKVAPLMDRLPDLSYVLLTDDESHRNDRIRSLSRLMEEARISYKTAQTDLHDRALLHFTSGTTGMPKGVIHVHEAALTHYVTGKYVVDFHPHDCFWCTADPGWVTGTSYGILAPLMHGVTAIVTEAEFDARSWYQTLEDQQVTVWYTAPTAIRRLMRMDINVMKEYDLSALRLILSVGEPLNPEAVRWAQKTFGMPILDNWWQTETGGIMIANYPSVPVKPGSMGLPLPGIEAAIVSVSDNGNGLRRVTKPGTTGQLALKKGWPSMFRGYLDDEERYKQCFVGDWYLTGDLASMDADGYFWFVGRVDDIIKTSGHMVGPFEVESALMEHPAVAEAAVIGRPDPVMGAVVKAFITLKSNVKPTEELNLEIKAAARKSLGPAVAPKEIEFMDELPKTRSGKIMRRLLRDQETERTNNS